METINNNESVLADGTERFNQQEQNQGAPAFMPVMPFWGRIFGGGAGGDDNKDSEKPFNKRYSFDDTYPSTQEALDDRAKTQQKGLPWRPGINQDKDPNS